MGKLTEEQKAERRASSNLKKRAHNRRWKELTDAEDAAVKEVDGGGICAAAKLAADQRDVAWKAMDAALADIDRQIRDLQALREAVYAEHSEIVSAAAKAQDAAWGEYLEAKRCAEKSARAGFPDMSGPARWSSACWTPPDGYLDLIRAEEAAKADKKAAQSRNSPAASDARRMEG